MVIRDRSIHRRWPTCVLRRTPPEPPRRDSVVIDTVDHLLHVPTDDRGVQKRRPVSQSAGGLACPRPTWQIGRCRAVAPSSNKPTFGDQSEHNQRQSNSHTFTPSRENCNIFRADRRLGWLPVWEPPDVVSAWPVAGLPGSTDGVLPVFLASAQTPEGLSNAFYTNVLDRLCRRTLRCLQAFGYGLPRGADKRWGTFIDLMVATIDGQKTVTVQVKTATKAFVTFRRHPEKSCWNWQVGSKARNLGGGAEVVPII